MDLRGYLDILQRRALLLLVPLVVVPVVAYLLSAAQDDMYRASADILLTPNNPDEGVGSVGDLRRDLADPDRYVEGQISLIQSAELAEVVGARLGVDADELRDHLDADQRGSSDVVRISYEDRDPERAARVADAFAGAYIENRRANQVAGLERAVAELQATLDELEGRLADLTARLADPALTDSQRSVLQAQLDASTARFQTLFERQQDLQVDISLKRGNAEVIQGALVPTAPSSPQPKRAAALGGVLGLLLGAAAVALAERFDDRIRDRADIEDRLGTAVLGEIPKDRASTRNPSHLAVLRDPGGQLSEAARQLRTSIQFLALEQPLHRVAITSSAPGEGKTLMAANLATAFAQAGETTVIVSGDFRLPRLEDIFTVPPGHPGLTELIVKVSARTGSTGGWHDQQAQEELEAAILEELGLTLVATGIPNLWLLPRGHQPPNPAELLGSPYTAAVMDVLAERFDMVLVDTPPLLAVADTRALSAALDGLVVVAASGQTRLSVLSRALKTAEATPARMLGVVLNKVVHGQTYGYGYGYGSQVEAPGGPATAPARPAPSTERSTDLSTERSTDLSAEPAADTPAPPPPPAASGEAPGNHDGQVADDRPRPAARNQAGPRRR